MSLHDRSAPSSTGAGLAVLYVAIGYPEPGANEAEAKAVLLADVALTVAFAAEFVTRFLAAVDRRAYLRDHSIDLVTLVPTEGARYAARADRARRDSPGAWGRHSSFVPGCHPRDGPRSPGARATLRSERSAPCEPGATKTA
jgi:hypothetical protein